MQARFCTDMDTRVFYFTGILGSGKTTFIDQTIGDLEEGQKSVIICTEVGDEDFTQDVPVEYTNVLSRKLFNEIQEKYEPDLVFIEDDGSKRPNITELVYMLPKGWGLVQIVCMINARTFSHYMEKAPNLLVEKIMPASMVIINRCTERLAETVRAASLRTINRQAEIWLEYNDHTVENYVREGESYFDLSEGELFLTEDDFALWYVEALDYPDRFDKVTINADLMVDKEGPADPKYDILGRWLMTCCEADLQFFPVACRKGMLDEYKDEDLVNVTAIVHKGEWEIYEGEGPILEIIDVKKIG